ncbi:hypothetical protein NliqN6_0174 [Naganishia liquefaciens]|uniref:Mg-dependent DNase n=1 Tax=Naganishia liquefaciens TaxID=104408 RepID=A0A8H3YCZ5_9TREE|nr:hypothetical protein NliqN6_0174 [Naganishia liquefaciens]
MRFIDIAVNLTDDMFQGKYRGKQVHEADLDAILERSKAAGVQSMIITGTSLSESKQALDMAARYELYATVGCHPTSTSEIAKRANVEEYFNDLESVIKDEVKKGEQSRIVAIGEIGLDYDRLHYSDAATQKAYFPRLLKMSDTYSLPLFLHSRHPDAHTDFVKTLKDAGWEQGLELVEGQADPNACLSRGRLGVVHSFTGTVEEMRELLTFGLYIGINGCSLKTEENLRVVAQIPLSRLMLETDAPWCSITGSHASAKLLPPAGHALAPVPKSKNYKQGQGVKGRNEPADITAVAWVVSQAMSLTVEQVAQATWENTVKVFFPHRKDWL